MKPGPCRLPRPRRRSPHRDRASRSRSPRPLLLPSIFPPPPPLLSSPLPAPLHTAGDALFSSPLFFRGCGVESQPASERRAVVGKGSIGSSSRPVPLPRRYVPRGYVASFHEVSAAFGWWISLAAGRLVGRYGRGSSHGRRRWRRRRRRRPCGSERTRRGERLVWTRPHRGGVLDVAALLLVPHRLARRRHPHRLRLVQALLQLQVKPKTFLNSDRSCPSACSLARRVC